MLQLATGAGKTAIFSTILKGIHEKGKHGIMLVRGRSLVEQASRRLSDMDVPHGVLMADHKGYDLSKKIQIASVDTVNSRGSYPNADILVIDEAHMAVSQSFKCLLDHYKDTFILGVTATPWVKEGLSHLASEVVYPISISELINQGHLVRPKYFVPNDFDVSKIDLQNGDFAPNQSLLEMSRQKISGNIIDNYKKNCNFEGTTFLFAVNLKHAFDLAEEFLKHGIPSVVITAKTALDERLKLIANNKLIISVGTLTTGVDVPNLRNIILARPTASKNLYIQMLGRGTRPYEGKEFFKVFDHVGNIQRHGFIEDEEKANLAPVLVKKKKLSQQLLEQVCKVCSECHAACHPALLVCKECGYKFPEKKRKLNGEGELKEIKIPTPEEKEKILFESTVRKYFDRAIKNGYKLGWVWYALQDDKKVGGEMFAKHINIYNKIRFEYILMLEKSQAERNKFEDKL